MYKTMLVTLDRSELAETVLDYARELAVGLDLDTILLHIYSQSEYEFISMRCGYLNRIVEVLAKQM